jgi:hypothetical protein
MFWVNLAYGLAPKVKCLKSCDRNRVSRLNAYALFLLAEFEWFLGVQEFTTGTQTQDIGIWPDAGSIAIDYNVAQQFAEFMIIQQCRHLSPHAFTP